MSCPDVVRLAALLAPDAEGAARVAPHLTDCAACDERLRALNAATMPVPEVPPPAGVRERVLAAVAAAEVADARVLASVPPAARLPADATFGPYQLLTVLGR